MTDEENGIKVILLGETYVGKTSLIKAALGQKFDASELTTFTSSYSVKKFKYNGQEYVFNLWDTIGQEKYRSLTKMFFKDSKIIILVYDITAKKTFEQLDYWYTQLVNQLGTSGYILAIVGNKKDLFIKEEVNEAQGKEFAKEKNAKFKLSSAKEDPVSFTNFLEEIFKEFIDNNKDFLERKKGTSLSVPGDKKKKKCC